MFAMNICILNSIEPESSRNPTLFQKPHVVCFPKINFGGGKKLGTLTESFPNWKKYFLTELMINSRFIDVDLILNFLFIQYFLSIDL
jgi:hypothetical protein